MSLRIALDCDQRVHQGESSESLILINDAHLIFMLRPLPLAFKFRSFSQISSISDYPSLEQAIIAKHAVRLPYSSAEISLLMPP